MTGQELLSPPPPDNCKFVVEAIIRGHEAAIVFVTAVEADRCGLPGCVGRSVRAVGVSPELLAMIKAPIGLVPRLRDPNLLASSVIAEIAAAFRDRFVAF